ncbi:hypothetical protein LSAT2_003625 [Lamellibrachia satsuma]|nr:hypothetical protein LSAT2_003625 [Lamellibrachia satsuma]
MLKITKNCYSDNCLSFDHRPERRLSSLHPEKDNLIEQGRYTKRASPCVHVTETNEAVTTDSSEVQESTETCTAAVTSLGRPHWTLDCSLPMTAAMFPRSTAH